MRIPDQLRKPRTIVEIFIIGNLAFLAVDVYVAHLTNAFERRPEWLPVVFSIAAPLLLIGTVVLSYAATLGVSALVFNHLLGFPGADPSVPLFGFVFLVALGVDYNIFLMTRVREESLKLGTRPGIVRGVRATGGVITAAGIVLAATFSALQVIPILFLVQISFIVAFGVLLDAILVRSLLVPALSYDLGRRIWWPSKLAKAEQPKA